jgi:hypothetical protein
MDLQWTKLTLLQILAGNTAIIVFAVAVVLVFLVLAAQYESLSLPLAVILVVPMCLLSSVIGVWLAGMDINIFVQIGFVVLVGLASKNAILIVEFAKEKSSHGASAVEATVEACRLRLRLGSELRGGLHSAVPTAAKKHHLKLPHELAIPTNIASDSNCGDLKIIGTTCRNITEADMSHLCPF